MNELIFTFLIALGSAGILAYPIFKGLIALKSRQNVSQHVAEHAHKQGTPTMGGLIILAGALPAMGYWATIRPSIAVPTLVLVIGYALIGFVDDFVLPRIKKGSRGFGWTPKLGLQVVFAGIPAWLLFPGDWTAIGLSVFMILFFSNAYNFADGLDWLAGTLYLALGLTLLAAAWILKVGVASVMFPAVAFLGGLLPFLVLNKPPAKIFMGDVGSMAIGSYMGLAMSFFLLAARPATGEPHNNLWITFLGLMVVSVVMIIELVPPPLQILSVKLRKKRLFPMTPIHHAYQKAGWPEPRIVGMFFTVQVVCSLIGLLILTQATR